MTNLGTTLSVGKPPSWEPAHNFKGLQKGLLNSSLQAIVVVIVVEMLRFLTSEHHSCLYGKQRLGWDTLQVRWVQFVQCKQQVNSFNKYSTSSAFSTINPFYQKIPSLPS